MTKYNILWLDDDPIKVLDIIKGKHPEIYFEKVDYIDICDLILDNEPEKFQAVIFDANGIKSDVPEIEANKSGFLPLVKKTLEKKIPVYIYSGQLEKSEDGDEAEIVLETLNSFGLKEKENIFLKTNGPYEMIDKILSDLDQKYQNYIGHEYLLSFFSEKWIKSEFQTEFMDPIMQYFVQKDIDSAHGNHMRNLTEQMLDKVNEVFALDERTKQNDPSRYVKIIEAIKTKKLDFSDTIAGPLKYMIEMSNARSHTALSREERELYFQSDFAIFFIVTHWFYKLLSNMERNEYVNSEANSSNETKMKKVENILPRPVTKPTTHEDARSGVVVKTYKENNRTYVDLKVMIPYRWKDYETLLITGVKPSDNPKSGDWFPYCQEVKDTK